MVLVPIPDELKDLKKTRKSIDFQENFVEENSNKCMEKVNFLKSREAFATFP